MLLQPEIVPSSVGLGFGNDMNAGSADALFFAAGPNGEADGLFGMIQAGA